jgi:HEPN domain-containing protein
MQQPLVELSAIGTHMLKATENWLAQVNYDLATAEHMLHAGQYIYVIFMSHLALEKMLKALVTEETRTLPPRTHNLIDLAQRSKLGLSQTQRDFIGKINNASIVTRYPDDLLEMVVQYPETVAREYLEQTKELITWLRQDPRLQMS